MVIEAPDKEAAERIGNDALGNTPNLFEELRKTGAPNFEDTSMIMLFAHGPFPSAQAGVDWAISVARRK